ncbi:MAG: polysaccharide biosynthesis C-terminal domain-containing protein [Sulfurimonas sp.]|nr:polysaccharide biosynthesis C-terminal domain-containing protein [Sulfurimonas sp.]
MLPRSATKILFTLSSAEMFLRAGKFVFFLLLAKLLTPELFGDYIYFTACFALVFVLSDFGISKIITKELSSDKEFDLLPLFWMRLLLLVVATAILFIILQRGYALVSLVGVLFFLDAISEMFYSIYRAREEFFIEGKIKFFIASAYLFSSALLYFYQSIDAYSALVIVAVLYGAIVLPYFKHLEIKLVPLKYKVVKLLFGEGFVLVLGAVFTIAYLRLDLFMIEYFLSSSSVASYGVSSKVIELAMIFPIVISTFLLPNMIKSKQFNSHGIFQQLILGLVIGAIFIVTAPYMLGLFFPNYDDAVVLVQILSVGIVFLMINNYLFTGFIAHKKSIYYLYTTSTMLIANALLNTIYIPLYGIEAAAYTTVFSELLGMLVALYLYIKLPSSLKNQKR